MADPFAVRLHFIAQGRRKAIARQRNLAAGTQ
ncbi:hypothetical protein METH_05160 [Leisingera methylohalidivorans DSM 14336]|uniref:Uncharacterized protein n=1 Tax=Leisingera methylohalidivorans DSM 14336 TaxID=999552 RepID=V9VY79_9RHOB|nr:hypothetical protein METH_05160 [Leisingera methylohalidivorans DSM 14336]